MDLKSLENPSYCKRTLNLWAPLHQPVCLGTDFLASSTFPNGLLASKCFRTIEWYNNFKAAMAVSGLQGTPCQGLGYYCSSQGRELSIELSPRSAKVKKSYANWVWGGKVLMWVSQWTKSGSGSLPHHPIAHSYGKAFSRVLTNFTLKNWAHWQNKFGKC